jgi:hypothetical protein
MALWGISTNAETAANNYAIPKYTSGSTVDDGVDINNTPHDYFADNRGWVQRHYGDGKYSGLSTSYYDEIHVPVAGLNTAGAGTSTTGLGLATPVAVFFKEPNSANPISVGGGGTHFISTSTSAPEVHLAFNENVWAGVGATMLIRVFDANNANESTSIVATAASVANGVPVFAHTNSSGDTYVTSFPGQISNRIAFTFTPPTTVLNASVDMFTTVITAGQTVAVGATIIPVDAFAQTTEDFLGVGLKNVAIGDSITAGGLTVAEIVAVGSTSVTVAIADTSATQITAGTAVTFSRYTSQSNLQIDTASGFIGIITDMATAAGVTSTFTPDILRQLGGAGDAANTDVGMGTTILRVVA